MLQHYTRLDRYWEIGSICYLAFPWLIFVLGWLNTLWALLGIGSLLGGLGWYIRHMDEGENSWPLTRKQGLWLLILGGIWVILSGMSGLSTQSVDYIKHHEIWEDLSQKSWPVLYHTDTGIYFLDYYLAYYLPGALLAKLSQGGYILASVLWGGLGVGLVIYGLSRWFQLHPLLSVGLFFLIGGQDMFCIWASNLRHFLAGEVFTPLPIGEWVGDPMAYLMYLYKGNMLQLSFAPQHALGGWLGTLLVWRNIYRSSVDWQALLPWALSFFWSPFVTVGLFPFVLFDIMQKNHLTQGNIYRLVFAGVLSCLVALFYQAHAPVEFTGFIWEITTRSDWFWLYGAFIISELGCFVVLVGYTWRRQVPDPLRKQLFWLSVLILVLLPLFHMGRFNDFVMRTSIPALMMIHVITIQTFWQTIHQRLLNLAFALAIIIGCIPAIDAVVRKAPMIELSYLGRVPRTDLEIPALNEIYEQSGNPYDFELAPQYLGHTDSFFYRQISKKP